MSFLSFKLSDDFVAQYEDIQPNWGFPIHGDFSLGELTYISKYSRIKDDGSKERWFETCRRVIEGMFSIQKDWVKAQRSPWNDHKAQRSAQDAYERMFTFKWLPPGRGLQHMGSRFVMEERDSGVLQNCFGGDETFLTLDGVRSFVDSLDEEVQVLTEFGWESAVVSSFGVQKLQRVVLKPNGLRTSVRHEVRVTPGHRWILSASNGAVEPSETTNLAVGDCVVGMVSPQSWEFSEDYDNGMLHGLIFGDGGMTSHPYADGRRGFELRACDSRTEQIAQMPSIKSKWDKIYTDRPSGNGDTFYFLKSHTNLKEFPSTPTAEYAAGFIRGWIAADASLKPCGSYQLDSQHPDSTRWLEDFAALAGFTLTGVTIESTDTNFGERKNPLRRHSLIEESMDWRVVEIEDLEVEEEVYCVTVPSTGKFTLSAGIYTGNCGYTTTERLSSHSKREAVNPFVLMMEMSMHGIGVGFDVNGAGKIELRNPEPASEPNIFVVPDSREGWAEAVGMLLETFFLPNKKSIEFDYSQIRPAGAPLKRFGGTASGEGPLRKCLESIRAQLSNREGEKITSRDIVDIMNKIGKAVVAGASRRSAQIVFGDPNDSDYVNLKNWNLPENAERTGPDGWAWGSNNSVFAQVGEEYNDLVESIVVNGEPGIMWLEMAQKFGRLADPENNRDYRARGGNPCLEQTLEPWELCTLVEVFPLNHDSFEDFKETLKVAYLYGKTVTLLPTVWPETNEVMARNRRIGCSLSGLAEFVERRGWFELREWMDKGYQFIQERDRKYSEWLAVRESIKTTSIKPSGTVSLLSGSTPGVHWPVSSGTYVRTMRFASFDPVLQILKDAGFHAEPAEGDPENTQVVTFVVDGPEMRSERDVPVWEKAQLVVWAQRWWADNQVSATLTFTPEEVNQIIPLLRSLDGQLKGISFLPLTDEGTTFKQAPYMPISEEDAASYRQNLSPVDLEGLYNIGAEVEDERFCNNDSCVI